MWKIELETGRLEGTFPMHRAWIIVSEHTGGHNPDHGMPTLSPELASMTELEHYIGRLRKQLDQMERAGKKYFGTPLFDDDLN